RTKSQEPSKVAWLLYFNSHTAGGAGDGVDGGVHGGGVQVAHLLFGNLFQLLAGDRANLLFVGHGRTFLDFHRFAQQVGDWRSLGYKGERTIFVHGNQSRNNAAALVGGPIVVGFAEFHDVQPMRTQSRTDWGSRISGTGW